MMVKSQAMSLPQTTKGHRATILNTKDEGRLLNFHFSSWKCLLLTVLFTRAQDPRHLCDLCVTLDSVETTLRRAPSLPQDVAGFEA